MHRRRGLTMGTLSKRRLTTLGAAAAVTIVVAAPATAAVTAPVLVSGNSMFAAGCSGHTEPGTNYLNTEVEPHLAVDPAVGTHVVAAWQQDRWDNGGSHGNVSAYSTDGGATWT